MERIVVGELYAEQELGLYVVRGENVVLLGDLDGTLDPPSVLQKVPQLHSLVLIQLAFRDPLLNPVQA